MSEIKEITNAIIKFRDERDWAQFHNPKDLALALSIESGELLESFLWKKHEEADLDKVKEELADVLIYALTIAKNYNLDVKEIILDKLSSNAQKYPVSKAKGSATKYTDL